MEEDWKPLESNPQVINTFLAKLGLDTMLFKIHDVMALEDWALEMLPAPVKAFVFLYGLTEPHLKFKENEDLSLDPAHVSKHVFYMKQYAMNACGTVALLHAIFNNPDLPLIEGSYLAQKKKLWLEGKMTPEEIGKDLLESKELKKEHVSAVHEGKTEICDEVNSHFIAFVKVDGVLYELDGAKRMPVPHGPTDSETFVKDCARVIGEFMGRDTASINYNIMALAASQ